MSKALLVFIKNAEKGKVKTRLAASVGDEQALKIYLALMDHTRKIAESVDGNRMVFYSQWIEENDNWSEEKFDKRLQSKGDLGVRMQLAFEQAFEENQKVVIIGSDCASLTAELVEEAFNKLDNSDFVIGPALDGGYYLLGMRSFEPMVFEDIEWSTDQVLRETVAHIQSLHKTYTLLPPLSDIDFAEDWKKWGWDV